VETGGTSYTTDFVLEKTTTLLHLRLDAESARTVMDRLLVWRDIDVINVILVNETVFQHTVALRRQYHDKPGISFTDLSSMAVMDELGISDVRTGDAHFEHVGTGLRRRS
jgi:predicted nucleic acid-binding protein